MTGREAERMEKEKAQVLTPGRLGTHWLRQVSDYPEAAGPLGVELVPGVEKGLCIRLHGFF